MGLVLCVSEAADGSRPARHLLPVLPARGGERPQQPGEVGLLLRGEHPAQGRHRQPERRGAQDQAQARTGHPPPHSKLLDK